MRKWIAIALIALPPFGRATERRLTMGPVDADLARKIDAYLTQAHADNMAGNGAIFVAEGRRYNVDPRLIVGIANAESSLGTRWGACSESGLNAWSYFWHLPDKTCPTSTFKSYAEGIHYVTADIRTQYLDAGRTTIESIREKYCLEGCDAWVSNVLSSYTYLGGLPSDLTYPAPPLPIAQPVSRVSFAGSAGGPLPPDQRIPILNTGVTPVTGLHQDIDFFQGDPGWLTASLTTTTLPTTLVLSVGPVAIAGTYKAQISVGSNHAEDGKAYITVTYIVSPGAPASPTIALSKQAVTFNGQAGATTLPEQTVSIVNTGTGTLSGLSVSEIAYGSGQPTGWLTATLSPTTAPATITFRATAGSSPAGTYTASVQVLSNAPGVTNSPYDIEVTLTINPADPHLTFSRIVSGSVHSCGLTTNGTAYCWGPRCQDSCRTAAVV